jgi:ubiquinone/menaquinone biosynthesis C-methylase UbiE
MCDDAEELKAIDDESVDFIVSKSLFEHLENPLKAVKATFRVLKREGISVHIIHLFTSISGGHNPAWYNFKRFEPWDHLRKEKFILPYGHLNKLRAQDYIEMFKRYFPVVFYEYYSSHIYKNKIDAILTARVKETFRVIRNV